MDQHWTHNADGSLSTLGRCLGISVAPGGGGTGTGVPGDDIGEDWRAEFLLCGGHFQDDKFIEAQVCFDYLSLWTRPDAVVTRKPGEDRVVIDIEDTVVDMASFDSRTKIKLCIRVAVPSRRSGCLFPGVCRLRR